MRPYACCISARGPEQKAGSGGLKLRATGAAGPGSFTGPRPPSFGAPPSGMTGGELLCWPLPSPGLQVGVSREGTVAAYGLLARENLGAGEELFRVPRTALLSQHTSALAPLLRKGTGAPQDPHASHAEGGSERLWGRRRVMRWIGC